VRFRGIGGTIWRTMLVHVFVVGAIVVNEVLAFWRRKNGSRNLGK